MFATTDTSTLLIFGFLLLLATPADATPAGPANQPTNQPGSAELDLEDLTALQSRGGQHCSADGSWFACHVSQCNQIRSCDSNPGLRHCACPMNSNRIQLFRWSSHDCPEDQHELQTSPFPSSEKGLNVWNNRGKFFKRVPIKVCTNGAITDVRLVGDVNQANFDQALKDCKTQKCMEFVGNNLATGAHTAVSVGLGLGSAIFSAFSMTTGPVLGGLGALFTLVGNGSPKPQDIMSEVDKRIAAASSELSWTHIQTEIEQAANLLKIQNRLESKPYAADDNQATCAHSNTIQTNPQCCSTDNTVVAAVGNALITTRSYVIKNMLAVGHLEGVWKTLPLLADLVYVAYTNKLGREIMIYCDTVYNQFREDWQKLLSLVDLVEQKYKEAKICDDGTGPDLTLSFDAGTEVNDCEEKQWKCYHQWNSWVGDNVFYCGDDSNTAVANGARSVSYLDTGVHLYSFTGRLSSPRDAKSMYQPEVAHVRKAFLDNQDLLLNPIKEYIAKLQTDVDQLCGYCDVRDSMIDKNRAIPVEIFLLAASQSVCHGSYLPACVSTLKRTYKRPEQPENLNQNELDFCGPTGNKNTLKKELQHIDDKGYTAPICEDLEATWPEATWREAGTTFLSHGDQIQPWSIVLLSIACLLCVFK